MIVRRAAASLALLGAVLTACSSRVAEQPAIPVGALVNEADVACPPEAPAGARCIALTARCDGLGDLGVLVAVSEPSSAATATVLLHDHAAGTTFFDEGFVAAYRARGMRVVQARWASTWEITSPPSIKRASCRPTALVRWIFDRVHAGDRAHGFCAQSYGGGSGGLAFGLAFAELGDVLDAVLFSNGPPFARVDYGCAPALHAAPAPRLCDAIPAPSVAYTDGVLAFISAAESDAATCGQPNPPADAIARWAADSILSPGAVLDYPRTDVGVWDCASGVDGATGNGALFVDAVTSSKSVTCVTSGCTNMPWPVATDAMAADLAARCIARHRG